jgi:hypothetical protein
VRRGSPAGSLPRPTGPHRWGLQIGFYQEDEAPSLPPVGLYRTGENESAPTLHHDQMAAMLDEGWDEDEDDDTTKMTGAVDYQPVSSNSPRAQSPYGTSEGGHGASSASLVPLARAASPIATGHPNGAYYQQPLPSRSSPQRQQPYSSAVDQQQHARRRSGGKPDYI